MFKGLIFMIKCIMANNKLFLDKKQVVNCYEEAEKLKIVYGDGTCTYIEIRYK